jgi:cytochrome c-type biogenesis protein CcmF
MLADLGYIAIAIAFLAAIYAAAATYYGVRKKEGRWVTSARNALLITFPLIALACILLIFSLLRDDYSIEYVWRVSSREMPTYLKVTALWGGQAGSILFFNLLLTGFTAAAMARNWEDQQEIMPFAILVASFTLIFFLGITILLENPFARVGAATAEGTGLGLLLSWPATYVKNLFSRPEMLPADGNGLNPLLRHPGMIIHPPMLYLGYTGFTIPFVFAMAALIAGKFDEGWIRITRRWTLTAWLFLGLGLILGGRWAYDVLGWGGYWAWDAVENSSLLPWLTGTAFLHSVMIQEKRHMFKGWNVGLIIFTYLLVILGTLNVRSGLVSSVHSFAQSNIGWFFLAFLGFMILFSLYWIIKRYDQLRSKNQINSFLSREAAFMANNVIFHLITGVTLFFTYLPVLSELVTGQRITVGASFYEKFNGPLFAALLILMGIAPLTMWYRTSIRWLRRMTLGPIAAATLTVIILFLFGVRNWLALLGFWIVTFSLILTVFEFVRAGYARVRSKGESPFKALSMLISRNRRRYGGYIIHLGVLVMAFGIISTELYQQETQIRLIRGNSVSLGDFSMTFNGVERFPGPDDLIISEASLDVFRNGQFVRTLNPRTELYTRTQQPMTIPGVRSTFTEDFYVIMINWEGTSADAATFRIYMNPLINWVWAGAFIFLAGTLVAAWPNPAEEKIVAAEKSRRRVAISGATGD